MGSASLDTKIIEHFLATSADYLGVNMQDQRIDNLNSPLTASTPKQFTHCGKGNEFLSAHGEMENA
jgi:hypothetical protein